MTSSGSILLVDDDRAVRKMIAIVLRQAGYRVTRAASGAEALDLCAGHGRFDLVISDIKMPGMSGVELIGHPKCIQTCRNVLLVSGCSDEELQGFELEPGSRLLRKPFRPADLLRVVSEQLGGDPAS